MDFTGIDQPATWIAFVSLAAMEIVLGIDNIVFITILTSRLPEAQRIKTARIGLFLALFMRIGLLFGISWVMSLTRPLITVMGTELAGKHLILLAGGLFLVGKATTELHHKMEGHEEDNPEAGSTRRSVPSVIAQIVVLDIVFSLDSVITAVGMVSREHIWVMVLAVIAAVAVMLVGAKPVGEFVNAHPTVKVLALSFLILIGVMLIAEALGQHIPKGYIYFAIAFSLLVEMVNLRVRSTEKRLEREQELSGSSGSD